MPIEIFTGQPGNGKTALMMERLMKESKDGTRPIFAAGIDGLQPGLATVLKDPRDWNAVADGKVCTCNDTESEAACDAHIIPNGSLIFVDEAWKWFGHLHDASRQATPKHVLDLAEHRHRGLDFVWTLQQPNQLFPFVRGLIGAHSHVVRRFGTKFIDVFRWGELQEDIKSSSKRELSQRTTRTIPSVGFGSYKSAEVHTIKPKIPLKVLALPVIVIVVIYLAWSTWQRLGKPPGSQSDAGSAKQSAIADAGATPHAFGAAAKIEPRWNSATEYAKDHLPRIATMPWTAPVFDSRPPSSDPLLVCMSSGAGPDGMGEHAESSCTCLTEQGTAYDISQPECRTIARRGPVYNPYRQRSIQPAQPLPQPQEPGQGDAPALNGSVVQRQARALGTFPESPVISTSSYTQAGENRL
ncbi:zonular occludens toxin domain-containing protein [Stenotrophomonas indicatrix]|uniref:zonular occludens toxin domain-containing protein n=1 Tax=Stenotrophomonas indicatrix TaxID=2045451 RepID=UPI0028EEE482|nr:zonular occludens toxin domain-containing protein [Stenotrophomonas indicatrix]MDT9580603.1 zonular occludens toxin domain-containing protein [Stenotrophomonas indicatrix]